MIKSKYAFLLTIVICSLLSSFKEIDLDNSVNPKLIYSQRLSKLNTFDENCYFPRSVCRRSNKCYWLLSSSKKVEEFDFLTLKVTPIKKLNQIIKLYSDKTGEIPLGVLKVKNGFIVSCFKSLLWVSDDYKSTKSLRFSSGILDCKELFKSIAVISYGRIEYFDLNLNKLKSCDTKDNIYINSNVDNLSDIILFENGNNLVLYDENCKKKIILNFYQNLFSSSCTIKSDNYIIVYELETRNSIKLYTLKDFKLIKVLNFKNSEFSPSDAQLEYEQDKPLFYISEYNGSLYFFSVKGPNFNIHKVKL